MINKDYLEREYKLAYLQLKIAHNDDEQWEARRTMARLELLASDYGFEYLDNLIARREEPIKGVF